MSIKNWNAGIIRPVAVAPTGPYQSGAAPGMWTLDQAAYWTKQGLWPTAGLLPNYIEDVFSTYLYTGNGWYNNINNSIALADGLNLIPGQSLQGGFFAGFISTSANGVATHALIVAPASGGQSPSNLAFGASGIVTGITSVIDGPTNSAALASIYSSPAALFCENLTLNGYSDWYLPARFELEIAYPTFKPTTTSNSGSGGANPYSVPARTVSYTSTAPAQTTVASFVSDASNAFSTQENWTSTESNANEARIIEFGNGTPNDNSKTSTRAVRAFRRIPVSDASLDPYRVTGKGGLVWFKPRNTANNHNLIDSARGLNKFLITNSAAAQGTTGAGYGVSSFNSNGFSLAPPWTSSTNTTDTTQVSWTFREQPKFFDIVTYTGNQAVGHNIPHNLGSAPGLIIVKAYDGDTRNWFIYHRSLGATKHLVFTADAETVQTDIWNNTEPTSTQFTVGDSSNVNQNGRPYIAYLFAHDAGGFGLSGSENVVTCGSYVGNGSLTSGPLINLGYEPQWVMVKRASGGTGNWSIFDTMRGFTIDGDSFWLDANKSDSDSASDRMNIDSSTGFHPRGDSTDVNTNGSTYIYIAIRRGPMKVPTLGNTVFSPIAVTASTGAAQTTGFPVDLQMQAWRDGAHNTRTSDRLRSVVTRPAEAYSRYINTDETVAEANNILGLTRYWTNTGFQTPSGNSGLPMVYWNFRRAPSFMDTVCYTGTGVARTVAHNLGVAPELVIIKSRSNAYNWQGGSNFTSSNFIYTQISSDGAGTTFAYTAGVVFSGQPTSTSVFLNSSGGSNSAGSTFVAYLFATCAGVSKVGSYTGTGTTQAINCGFTAGARFVLIKRTDSTGDWYVWDSARGIVAGNDPYLLLNSTAAEVTNTDYVDTSAAGFEISSTAPAAINANGGTFIFLAIS